MDAKERVEVIISQFNELPLDEQNATIKRMYEMVQVGRAKRIEEINLESAKIRKSMVDLDQHFDNLLHKDKEECCAQTM